MGQIADDKLSGFECSHCGICFEDEHGFPVLCITCFAQDAGGSGIPEAHIAEIGGNEEDDQ